METSKDLMIPQEQGVVTGAESLVKVRLDKVNYPRIARIPDAQLISSLSHIILSAYAYRGQQADESSCAAVATVLLSELKTANRESPELNVSQLTLIEIERAIKDAVLGKTGREMYGLGVASLYQAIIDYIKGAGHQAQIQANAVSRSRREERIAKSGITELQEKYAKQLINKH